MALLLCALAAAPAAAQSDSSTLRVREAAAALVRGNVDQAITIYGEVLEDKSLPNDRRATILNDRGVAFSRRQQQKEAIEDFNRAIQLYPEYAAVYNNRGNVLARLGKRPEGVACYRQAIQLMPNYADAYANLGSVLMDLGEADEAEASMRRAVELQPGASNFCTRLFNELCSGFIAQTRSFNLFTIAFAECWIIFSEFSTLSAC